MKLLIASDIHGSASGCRSLIDAFEAEHADRLILLGDILYHGPRNDLPDEYFPKGVITMLNRIHDKLLCVRGNCDSEVDQMVLNFPIMAEYAVFFEAGHMIYLTHGHKNDALTPFLSEGDIIISGHTHIPACERRNGYEYLNPGSISIPKNNTPHSYMLLDGGKFIWKDILSGDIFNTISI
jgi:putative phosphoesterase